MEKKCFKCGCLKPLLEYYKHKGMADGHLNKCKSCTKSESNKRLEKLSKDPDWINKEQARGREKYYRLGYKDKYTLRPDQKAEIMRKHKLRFPEKYKARTSAQRMPRPDGVELHHWSYNEEHFKDIIPLTIKDHAKAHRFIKYDESIKKYRRKDTNELLRTKNQHADYIRFCIEFKD